MPFTAAMSADMKTLYYGDASGAFRALASIDGTVKWNFTVSASAPGTKSIMSSVAVGDFESAVYFGSAFSSDANPSSGNADPSNTAFYAISTAAG